jgi:Ca2+-binding EF-hand superfamily protein
LLGGSTPEQEEKQQAAAAIFFGQIDGDGDGQIGAEEARSYVAGLSGEEFDTTEEVSRAVQDMMGDLDGSDKDTSISLAEFMAHTHVMLQVGLWQHGAG